MKTAQYAAVIVIANALGFANAPDASPKDKDFSHHSGGKAAAHMSSKGSANSNAQWSADPERGWVRAEERRGQKNHGTPSKSNVENKGKQNGDKGKKL